MHTYYIYIQILNDFNTKIQYDSFGLPYIYEHFVRGLPYIYEHFVRERLNDENFPSILFPITLRLQLPSQNHRKSYQLNNWEDFLICPI